MLNNHPNKLLRYSCKKYGVENFKFDVIQYCKVDELIIKEQQWMDYTKCYEKEYGYNLCNIASSTLGIKHNEESITKMSKSRKNNKNCVGRKYSETTIQKMRDAKKGKKPSINSIKKRLLAISKKPDKYKEVKIMAKKLHNLGLSTRQIAKELNISKGSVFNWLSKGN